MRFKCENCGRQFNSYADPEDNNCPNCGSFEITPA